MRELAHPRPSNLQSAAGADTMPARVTLSTPKEALLARQRYQRGMMELRERRDEQGHIDKERSEWIGRWREDEVSERGVRRVKVWEILGSLNEFPTRKLALRELARRIGAINDSQYRPRRVS